MKKLPTNDYKRIQRLTEDVSTNKPILFSVIEGTHPGTIYVNDRDFPQYALIVTQVNYMFVVGKIQTNADAKEIYEHIFNNLVTDMVEKEVILFTENDENRQFLDEELKYKGMITIERNIFEFDEARFKNNALEELNDDFKLVPLDHELAKAALLPIDLCDFEHYAFGFALLKDKKVISTCYSLFIGTNEVEIDVKTNDDFKFKGYATHVASAFINSCLSRGLKPNWSCWPYNVASINLAKKLGFKSKGLIPAHFWSENM